MLMQLGLTSVFLHGKNAFVWSTEPLMSYKVLHSLTSRYRPGNRAYPAVSMY